MSSPRRTLSTPRYESIIHFPESRLKIILYLLARVLSGLAVLVYEKFNLKEQPLLQTAAEHSFRLKAMLCWGLVMWLFQEHRHTLQLSLQSSMQYLYIDSEYWRSWWDLLVVNKRTD